MDIFLGLGLPWGRRGRSSSKVLCPCRVFCVPTFDGRHIRLAACDYLLLYFIFHPYHPSHPSLSFLLFSSASCLLLLSVIPGGNLLIRFENHIYAQEFVFGKKMFTPCKLRRNTSWLLSLDALGCTLFQPSLFSLFSGTSRMGEASPRPALSSPSQRGSTCYLRR